MHVRTGRRALVLATFLAVLPLTSTPRPAGATLVLTPQPLDFGTQLPNVPTERQAILTNQGATAVSVLSSNHASARPDLELVTPLPLLIEPGESGVLTYRFTRTDSHISLLAVLSLSDPGQPAKGILFSGEVSFGQRYAWLSVDALDFGTAIEGTAGERTFAIENRGSGVLQVHSVEVPDGYEVLTATPFTLASWKAKAIRVRWRRDVPETAAGNVVIHTDGTYEPVRTLSLQGVSQPTPIAVVDPGTLDPVDLAFGQQHAQEIVLRNDGVTTPLEFTAGLSIDGGSLAAETGPEEGLPALRLDAGGHPWPVGPDGSIGSLEPGGFAEGGTWSNFPAQATARTRDGGRTFVLESSAPPLRFRRMVHVSPSGSYVRYLDTVSNEGTTAAPYRIRLHNEADMAEPIRFRTSGGGSFTTTDDWVVLIPEGGPSLVHVLNGPGGAAPAYAALTFGLRHAQYDFELVVAPGERASVLHFLAIAPDEAAAVAEAERLRGLPADAMRGIGALDRDRIVNFNAHPARVVVSPSPLGPSGSGVLRLEFDGGKTAGDEDVQGRIRLATNDRNQPGIEVPFSYRILGAGEVIGVPDPGVPPPALALAGRFAPNPVVGDRLRFAYVLPEAGTARFELYDVRGRKLGERTLEDAAAGAGSLAWGGRLPAGIVWMRLSHQGRSITTRAVVLP